MRFFKQEVGGIEIMKGDRDFCKVITEWIFF